MVEYDPMSGDELGTGEAITGDLAEAMKPSIECLLLKPILSEQYRKKKNHYRDWQVEGMFL